MKTGNIERWKNSTDLAETIRSFKEHSHGLELGEKNPMSTLDLGFSPDHRVRYVHRLLTR